MATRSVSQDLDRAPTRSPTPASDYSRNRRRQPDSRSPSRSRSPETRRNGRYRSETRSRSPVRRGDSRGRSPTPVKSTKIVVERLTKNVNEDHLYEIFGQFGHVKDLDLPINRMGTNRGTAYILYDDEADAEDAIANMHEAQLDSAVINLAEAPA
ncbi:RNA-binding protein with serine-rich domain 1 like [Verticillium longisporum]|uniref:RNA-binding protein with serine-rich domain 1 like n=1 Tax=Verticillium longisporum TaxID=100787 RepID=A0A8I2ZC16_VERLO|nr:RNA-binding protein with serine-rich domain 1 like [Verticillium longisporum]